MAKEEEPLVLVGFGKHSLTEVLSWFGTPKEAQALSAPKKWPPVWRPERLCSEEEVENFVTYVQKVQGVVYTDYINF